jgi:hypothetical protein
MDLLLLLITLKISRQEVFVYLKKYAQPIVVSASPWKDDGRRFK